MIKIPNYQINDLLYESTHTKTFRAIRLSDNLSVILKILQEESYDLKLRAKFKKEFILLQQINSPYVIKAYDSFVVQNNYIIVLEDFEGEALNFLSPYINNLSFKEKIALMIQITLALQDLHIQKIIHKDINPSNIVFNIKKNILKFIDLGLSISTTKEISEINNVRQLSGTLAYISPEQTGRMNRSIDYRSDFYSLGITFYEILTNTLPFTTEEPLKLIYSHIALEPKPISDIFTNVPKVLSDIVDILIQKSADNRYQSLAGILFDLKKCYNTINQQEEIINFTLRSKDFSPTLVLSQKLYGRSKQLATIVDTFMRVSKGKSEFLLIKGLSGTGKSVLVQEIQKPLSYSMGYFIKGKFDQFKKEIPYYAFIQAFQELIKQILTEPEDKLKFWKTKLQNNLSVNAKIITDVIPELELVIGPQPEVANISFEQAKHRFHHEFINFLSVFCCDNQPLVIYLDDLQWVDSPSLQLIELILNSTNIKHLLLIGSYSENEVDNFHPLSVAIKNIEKNCKIQNILLLPLTVVEVNELLSDSLNCEPAKTYNLAEICHRKTQGNHFFLTQLLQLLVDKNILYPNVDSGTWDWNIIHVQESGITDNMIDIIVDKIKKLPLETQNILHIASCFGNIFDAKNLVLIAEKTEKDVSSILWDCMNYDLITPLDSLAPYYDDNAEPRFYQYRFLHDKIQKSSYELFSSIESSHIHLKIAKMWLSTFSKIEIQNSLFDILNHITLGANLINHERDFMQFLTLNLMAAKKAKSSAAYKLSLIYIEGALVLLAKKTFHINNSLLYELYLAATESAYLCRDFVKTEIFSIKSLKYASSPIEEASVKLIQIKSYIAQDYLKEAISYSLETLKQFGIQFPTKNLFFHIVISLFKMEFKLNKKSMLIAENLSNSKNVEINLIVDLLSNISTPIFYTNPKFYLLIILAQIKIFLKHGYTSTAPYIFASYGAILSSRLNKFSRAKYFSQFANRLQDKQADNSSKSRMNFIIYAMIDPWITQLHKVLPHLYNNYHLALETGDVEFSENSIQAYIFYSSYTGSNLYELKTEIDNYLQIKIEIVRPSIQMSLNFLAKFHDFLIQPLPENIETTFFNFEELDSLLNSELSQVLIFEYCSLKVRLCVIFKKQHLAIRYINALAPYIDSHKNLFGFTMYCFYESLCLISNLNSFNVIERKKAIITINKNLQRFKTWSKQCPENFLHIFHLIKAEKYNYSGKRLQAIYHYEQSVKSAQAFNFFQDEALAKELFGEYYLKIGQDFSGTIALLEAQNQYNKWGANAKVQQITLLNPNLFNIKKSAKYSMLNNNSKSYSRNFILESLDLSTIIKATQTLSQEIVLSSLLKHLIEIVIQSTGAQKGLLLLKTENGWSIQAEKKDAQHDINILKNIDLNLSTLGNDYLPISLVNYVIRTLESVIVDNAMTDKIVLNDYYVQKNKPKSLVLIPIIYHKTINGLLYLENNNANCIFSQKHLEILHILTAQAAISIENAYLYANMEQRISDRTAEIKEMSLRDTLTGVPNRKAFDEKLHEEFDRFKRSNEPLSVLIIDIDHFKKVNDTYGHLVGDECLKLMGVSLLKIKKRSSDFVARYGGEEFIFILPSTNLEGAIEFASEILEEIRTIVLKIGDKQHPITASIGVACSHTITSNNSKALISLADDNLYKAKANGRNQVIYN